MKIAIDISQIIYEGTGVASYTDQLVTNLLQVDTENQYLLFGITLRKYSILSEYLENARKLNKKVNGKFFHLPQKLGNIIWNKLHLFNLDLLLGPVDIFHSSDWIQPPASTLKVTTIHDLIVYKYPETSHPEIIETQKRRLYWVKKECDLIFSDSYSTKHDLINILRFDESKIEVIYPGINEIYKKQTEENVKQVRQKYGLLDEYILSVGTNEPRKNLGNTINAFEKFLRHPLIKARKKPIELVLIGKGGWGEKPKKGRYIHQLGYVMENDLPSIYSGASLFVYPSFYEGFGLPVLEAMACGTPVITSSRGSLKEITDNCALKVDPDNDEEIAIKMTQIMIDRNLKQDLTEKGLKNTARFNWKKTAEKVIDSYIKLNEKINDNRN